MPSSGPFQVSGPRAHFGSPFLSRSKRMLWRMTFLANGWIERSRESKCHGNNTTAVIEPPALLDPSSPGSSGCWHSLPCRPEEASDEGPGAWGSACRCEKDHPAPGPSQAQGDTFKRPRSATISGAHPSCEAARPGRVDHRGSLSVYRGPSPALTQRPQCERPRPGRQ